MKRLIIIGAGGFGHTVADIARQSGRYEEIFFLDDHSTAPEVKSCCADFVTMSNDDTDFYPAFGDNERRLNWFHRLMEFGCNIPVLVHPTAYVSPTAQLILGTVVLPKAVVNTGCLVKAGCIINCGAIVDHGCVLDECVHVCLGAIVKGENHIPACMKIDAGQVVENRTYPL